MLKVIRRVKQLPARHHLTWLPFINLAILGLQCPTQRHQVHFIRSNYFLILILTINGHLGCALLLVQITYLFFHRGVWHGCGQPQFGQLIFLGLLRCHSNLLIKRLLTNPLHSSVVL